MENNYEKQVYMARAYFLKYDQHTLIKKFSLQHDGDWIYLRYIGGTYRIHRKSGAVEEKEGTAYRLCEVYTTVMTIYDLLCYAKEPQPPLLTGIWQPVSAFAAAGSSPSADIFSQKYAKAFDGKKEEVKQACETLGGIRQQRLAGADLTFQMPVFQNFSVLFQYWEADEEFPPKILLLWDQNALAYLHFETTYYLQGDLLEAIYRQLSS